MIEGELRDTAARKTSAVRTTDIFTLP